MYCFRVPFRMSDQSMLGITHREYELLNRHGTRIWLSSTDPEQPLSDATSLVIRGEGFANAAEAAGDGEVWRDVISRALARLHLAADFGDRRPSGGLTSEGERYWSAVEGRPVLADTPGVTVYRCNPSLAFMRMEAKGCRRPSSEQTDQVFRAASDLGERLTPVERLAFDLFSGSFFQPSADARLLMLTMALETLIDPQPRSRETQAHVGRLIAATQTSLLTTAERESLAGSLSWMLTESIGQAGRRLARTLEPRRYMDLSPSKFFTRCYELRSALVHGHVPQPTMIEVDLLAANLTVFVGHLLSGELLIAVSE